MVQESDLKKSIVLIFANKQDGKGALDLAEARGVGHAIQFRACCQCCGVGHRGHLEEPVLKRVLVLVMSSNLERASAAVLAIEAIYRSVPVLKRVLVLAIIYN